MVQIAFEKADVSAEIDGVWVPYHGAELLIARLGNPRNRRAYEQAQARFKSRIRKGKETVEERIEILCRTMARSILLDWKGVEDMHGSTVDYSEEAAYNGLKWDQELREFVTEQADITENFRQAEVEARAKKSPGGTAGKSATGKS